VREIELYGMTREEVRLSCLEIIGYIWDQNHIWGDTHSTEMNKNSEDSALLYISNKINTPGAVGRIGAFQTLCLISKGGALIPEFCSRDVLKSILKTLHAQDPKLRIFAAEILKNFSTYPKMIDYIDTLDLLRNMIDAFYSTDDNKNTNLLLQAFLNLADHVHIRVLSTDPASPARHRDHRQGLLAALSKVDLIHRDPLFVSQTADGADQS